MISFLYPEFIGNEDTVSYLSTATIIFKGKLRKLAREVSGLNITFELRIYFDSVSL